MFDIKKTGIVILMLLLLVAIAGALDVLVFSPSNNYLDLNGNLTDNSNSFICSAQASANTNVSNVSRWDNSTGTWQRNQSNLTFLAKGTAWQNVTFIPPKNFSDGFSLLWGCEVCVNGTNVAGGDVCLNTTWTKFTPNQTVRVELPANITLEVPAANNLSSTKDLILNFTVRSDYIGNGFNNNLFDCRVWDNSSNSWTQSPLGVTAINNTTTVFPHSFSEANNISWNVQCAERNEINVKGFASGNFSILVDVTNPLVTLNLPVSDAVSASRTVTFNYTPTDTNLRTCTFYHNASGSWALNHTNSSVTSGNQGTAALNFNIDGNILWGVGCNDTVGKTAFASNRSFTIDTSDSTMLNITNFTVSNTCTKVGVNWNTSEARNGSISYGTTVNLGTNETVHTDRTTSHYANLTFGKLTETVFYYNATSCDASGNCNTSANSVNTPARLCNEGGNNAGWNGFAILNNGATLGKIANQSGASLAYWWNATGQSWVFNQQGTTSNANVPVNYGNAVLLYSATNSTWFRNTTVTGNYTLNLTQGDNFFGFVSQYSFWNLSQSFKNETLGESIPVYGAANLTNNTVFFASFNNTIHNYISHYRGYSWENSTPLQRGEMGWAWVERFNLTWNTSAIIANTSLLS
ncbi:hypothetical protein HY571_01845 [Candidatus Micrarchaeota archaeon]|nr:hypothetical protein [Candidatus Micrarchaeota archaeon]